MFKKVILLSAFLFALVLCGCSKNLDCPGLDLVTGDEFLIKGRLDLGDWFEDIVWARKGDKVSLCISGETTVFSGEKAYIVSEDLKTYFDTVPFFPVTYGFLHTKRDLFSEVRLSLVDGGKTVYDCVMKKSALSRFVYGGSEDSYLRFIYSGETLSAMEIDVWTANPYVSSNRLVYHVAVDEVSRSVPADVIFDVPLGCRHVDPLDDSYRGYSSDVFVDSENSFFEDFYVENSKVFITCSVRLKNICSDEIPVSLSAEFPDDVNTGLLKSGTLSALNSDGSEAVFVVPADASRSFEVTFVGDFAGTALKSDRTLPQITVKPADRE